MKVIFILPNLGSGGAERVVTILSERFAKGEISVDIVMLLTDKVQYQVPQGVELIALNTLPMNQGQRIKCLRGYLQAQKKRYGNVVAVPFQDNCLKYALTAAVGLGIPVIACERNDPYQKGRGGLARVKANLPYLLSSRCVFQTPDARDYYWRPIGRKGTVIANPLRLPEDLHWQEGASGRIVSVGRLDPQKNQKILLEAFGRLHREFPEYTLEIYGEGPLKEQLEVQIHGLGLENAAFLRGHSPDIHRILSQSAMFVLPSDYEGMSNALMEALAIGVPTVSTDHPIGGAKFLVEDGVSGILTPVGDAAALYEAMKRLLENADLARTMGKNAEKNRDRLSADRIAQQWLDVLTF